MLPLSWVQNIHSTGRAKAYLCVLKPSCLSATIPKAEEEISRVLTSGVWYSRIRGNITLPPGSRLPLEMLKAHMKALSNTCTWVGECIKNTRLRISADPDRWGSVLLSDGLALCFIHGRVTFEFLSSTNCLDTVMNSVVSYLSVLNEKYQLFKDASRFKQCRVFTVNNFIYRWL